MTRPAHIHNRLIAPCRKSHLIPSAGLFLRPCHRFTLRPYREVRSFQHRYLTTTTTTTTASSAPTFPLLRQLLLGTTIALTVTFGYIYVTDTRAGIHLLAPSVLKWRYEDDAEEAHEVGNRWLRGLWAVGLYPRERGRVVGRGNGEEEVDLSVQVFGYTLDNPIGTSAGIDKHAEIPDPLLALGPALIELGGATPNPQDGNPKPRVFRLPSQNALVNRYGLNSEGADDMAMRLRKRVRSFAYKMGFGVDEAAEQMVLDGAAGVPGGSLTKGKLMAVQVAKNKATVDSDIEAVRADYVYCVNALAKYADIIVVNVSSPNTPGLRDLQATAPLTHILTGVVGAAHAVKRKTLPAVMVKVSPDEDSDEQVRGICDAVWASGVDGVIVGNTTRRRPDPLPRGYSLPPKEASIMLEQGGYSGPQLFERTRNLVARYRMMLDEEEYMDGVGLEAEQTTTTPSQPSPSTTSTPQRSTPIRDEPVQHNEKPADPMLEPLSDDVAARIDATTARDAKNLKPDTPEAVADSKQPIIKIPARNNPFASDHGDSDESPALSSNSHIDQLPPNPSSSPARSAPSTAGSSSPPESSSSRSHTGPHNLPSPATRPPPPRKIIFATGGITTGAQALEVLEAGASVAQVYTALVYGGVGTITRMKTEMKEEMAKRMRAMEGRERKGS